MQVEYQPLKKRSICVGHQKSSLSLEECFWVRLKEIAARREMPVSQVLTDIEFDLQGVDVNNLTSAVRQFILHDMQEKIDQVETRLAVVLPSEAATA